MKYYLFLIVFFINIANASLWVDADDISLRHDLQLLADYGIITTPLTTWPLTWEDIAKDVLEASVDDINNTSVLMALERVKSKVEQATDTAVHFEIEAGAHDMKSPVQGFDILPRADVIASVAVEKTGEHLAFRLQATGAYNPWDDESARADGSYLAWSVGNWILSLNAVDRWWGPGWDGSLILGNNSRPVPNLVLQRNQSNPYPYRWLQWLGPWTFTAFIGQLEHDRTVPDAKLVGFRYAFKPYEKLEIGLSRTAQWAGEGRPSDFQSFVDLLLGIGENSSLARGIPDPDQPGNQLFSLDFRWRSPFGNYPVSFYSQFLAEDEAGGLPSRWSSLFGIETWGHIGNKGSYRLQLEFADTLSRKSVLTGQEFFNYTYNHSIYKSGYTYYGEMLGHSIGRDMRLWTINAFFARNAGGFWGVTLRHGKNSIGNYDFAEINLFNRFIWRNNNFHWGVGVFQEDLNNKSDSNAQFFFQYNRKF